MRLLRRKLTEIKMLNKPFKKAFAEREIFLGKNFHEKKGQVTVFIIVGILIVIIAGGLIFVNRDRISFRGFTSTQVEPVREYIRECINNIVKEDLLELRKNGGFFYDPIVDALPNRNVVCSDGTTTRLHAQSGGLVYTNGDLDSYIEDRLETRIDEMCSLSSFDDQFNFNSIRDIDVDVFFRDLNIDISVDMGVVASKGVSSLDLGRFDLSVNDDINRLNAVAEEAAEMVYLHGNFEDRVNEINDGVFVSGVDKNSRKILGDDCSNRPNCYISCPSGCCIIKNKFAEENDLQEFRFGLR